MELLCCLGARWLHWRMPENLPHKVANRTLKPLLTVLDRRIERLARRGARQTVDESRTVRDLKSEAEKLRKELKRVRADMDKMRDQSKGPTTRSTCCSERTAGVARG